MGETMELPKINLQFEASEWMALCELAQKNRTDVSSIIKIGALLLLEADRRGVFRLVSIGEAPRLLLPKGVN
jgi:hypothetical protein